MERARGKKNIIFYALSILLALLIWQAAAMAISQRILLATPIDTARALVGIVGEPGFLRTVLLSVSRILGGLFLGIFVGCILALVSSRFSVFELLIWPYIAAIRITPVVSFIILCLVWFSGRNLSVFISFLMVLPVVYINLLDGLKHLDGSLLQMAQVYCLKPVQRLLFIYLPQLKVCFFSAFKIAAGLAFKAGMAAEVIAIPAGSIGRRLYDAKLYLATDELLAWTVVIVAAALLCEKLLLFVLRMCFSFVEGLLWK